MLVADDVRVLEVAKGLDLLPQQVHARRTIARAQELERDLGSRAPVGGEINLAKAARTKLLGEFVGVEAD